MVWDAIIAAYLFLAGVGAGSFAFAALAGWRAPEARKVKMAGMVIGLVAVALGTVMLIFDAKAGFQDPLKFLLLLSNFGSVMTWGVVILSVFLVVAFVEILLYWRTGKTPRALDWVGIVLALCVATYTGVLLGVCPSCPLWNLPLLPILFVVSATATGFAATELAGYALDRAGLEKAELPAVVGIALPVVELAVAAVLLLVTANAGGVSAAAGAATVAGLVGGAWAPAFWGLFIVVGLVVPLAIALAARARKQGVSALSALGWACVLVGGFTLRYLVVRAAVPIVAY